MELHPFELWDSLTTMQKLSFAVLSGALAFVEWRVFWYGIGQIRKLYCWLIGIADD